ncbi:Isopropylmalate/citramalate isomerase small subunit [Candidatus Methanobinarius endosymbioticus]|uniref:Methanogen homoaconitase small subunit n=1 Tax=Candidatus Methanobinarius endosymbioticus TaxID=2006182 RepID=A0A366MF52_9EURY|nr:Isopropylmalate/citramalate isomerase small subunit [Candidatus Methanobinarius endosymbioticus]
MNKIEGKVWKFGDNIDTDVIIPGRYLRTFDPNDLVRHVMAGEREDFAENVQSGDIIVADNNFGCGSSREQAPVAIKTSGISVVIAKSFARIFYRNAINIGLPVVKADINANEGDILSVDPKNGLIINDSSGKSFEIEPFKEFMLDILNDGGLVKHYLNEEK